MPQEQTNPNDPQQPDENQSQEQSQPKTRKRRKWPWVILILLLLVLGLVLLGPTIASSGPVRSVVVGKVNENLNGTVEIGDWSLGWFSPISVSGIKVYDDQKRLILDVPKIQLGISILDAAKQNFNFGDNNVIEVASFDVRVDENGKSNLEKLTKTSNGSTSASSGTASSEPAKIPNVTGQFTMNFRGTVEAANTPPVYVDPSSAIVKITDINKPIENTVKLAYRVGDSKDASTIQTSGTVDAIENNVVNIDKLVAAEKIVLQNVNLAAAEPLAKKNMPDLKVSGVANGTLDVNAQGLTGISANGSIIVANLLFGGGPLGTDQFKTNQLSIPISVTRTVVDANTTVIKIEKLGAEMSQATVAIAGQVNEQALLNLAKQQPPGSDGTLTVNANVIDLKDLATQLRNTLKLDPSVQIDSGKITNAVAVNITKESVKASVNVNADAKGRRANQPIELKPIAMSFEATALPTGKAVPNVKDVKLNLNSDFMTITGGGETLAKIDIKGNYDLSKLRAEAAQFADLSKIQLQGTGDFAVTTSGDVADPNAPIDANATVNLQNVKIAGVANQQIDQDKLAIVAGGKITRKDNAPIGVQGGSVKLTSGDATSPLLTLNAAADLDLSKPQPAAPKWQFAIDTSNLATLQKQYGGLVPVLAQKQIDIISGGLHLNGSGSYHGKKLEMSEPVQMSIASLDVTKEGKPIISRETIRGSLSGTISMGMDNIAADLKTLSLTSQSGLITVGKTDAPLTVSIVPSKNDISGNGTITIASNIKRVSDLVQSFSGPATQPAAAQLRSGQFNGTVALTKADTTKIDFNGSIGSLTVATGGKNAIDNEQVTIALNAVAPSDLAGKSPIKVTGKIGSSFVNTTISDVIVLLSAASVLDMLQSATVDTQAPDLAKLYALATAFAPPETTTPAGRARQSALQQAPADDAPVNGNERISRTARAPRAADRGDTVTSTEPIAPLEITRGAASIKLNLNRDVNAKKTTVNLTDMQISNLGLRRGERAFDAKQPIAMKLTAALTGASPDKIDAIQIDQLSGSTEFATFQASKPIAIKDPTGPTPTYDAELTAKGSIENALGLVSVLQGADKLPYSGDFDARQSVSSKSGPLALLTNINVNNLRVFDAQRKQVFAENRVSINADALADLAKKNATVNSLTIDMPQSEALAVKFSGKLSDWENNRAISGLNNDAVAKASYSYDLDKIWAIVKPMLPPDMQEQYAKMPVKGKFSRDLLVSGMIPKNVAAGDTIFSKLNISGALPLEMVNTPQGLDIRSFELVFEMKNGRIDIKPAPASASRVAEVTSNARRPTTPTTRVTAKTGIANDGAMNLDGIVIELNKPDMPVSISPKRVLLNDVKLNSVLADSLGKMGMVISTNASKAEGRLTITVAECDHVPLGDLLRRKSGKAKFVLQIEDFELQGVGPSLISQVADLGTDGLVGSVPPSTISLEKGLATTDLTIQINKLVTDPKTNREVSRPITLKLTGGMTLSDLALKNFMIEIPPDLILRDMRKIFPNGVSVPLTGTANKPSLNIQKLVQENAAKGLLGNITGGNSDSSNRNNSNRPNDNNNTQKNNDPIGNILDQLNNGNNDRNRQNNPQNPPNRQDRNAR